MALGQKRGVIPVLRAFERSNLRVSGLQNVYGGRQILAEGLYACFDGETFWPLIFKNSTVSRR